MAYYVGDTITDTIALLDAAGDPILGVAALITIPLAESPSGADFSGTVTITEIDDGDYQAEWIVTEAGTWTIRYEYPGPPVQSFGPSLWDVDAAVVTISTVVPAEIITAQVGTTYRDLRREIQDRLDDLIVLTCTEAGTTTTLVDDVNLYDSSSSMIGSFVLAVSGTTANVGKVRRVNDNTNDLANLSFAPELPAATLVGDVFDLCNLNGAGWAPAEILRRVNAVLHESFPRLKVKREDTLVEEFSRDTPFIDIPDNVTHNYKVRYQDSRGEWWDVPHYDRVCHRASLQIELRGASRGRAHGCVIRLYGYGKHPAVSADTDLIYVNPRWLVLEVASRLGAQPSRNQAMRQMAAAWANEASQSMGVLGHSEPNTERVR